MSSENQQAFLDNQVFNAMAGPSDLDFADLVGTSPPSPFAAPTDEMMLDGLNLEPQGSDSIEAL
jgi:hypothetical protein